MKEGLIRGRVAQLLDERELVITVGSDDSVQSGMRFKVLAETPTPITDPETGETLGPLDREKVRVQVTEVHERFSVCRTYETKIVGSWSIGQIVGGAAVNNPRREVPVTLRADRDSLPSPLPEDESYVKRGDRVVELVETQAIETD
ncbi:MAG: hypothetical protein WKF67_09410 [Rubrobacteraceae bacterium]